jgi:hypothetical protein
MGSQDGIQSAELYLKIRERVVPLSGEEGMI